MRRRSPCSARRKLRSRLKGVNVGLAISGKVQHFFWPTSHCDWNCEGAKSGCQLIEYVQLEGQGPSETSPCADKHRHTYEFGGDLKTCITPIDAFHSENIRSVQATRRTYESFTTISSTNPVLFHTNTSVLAIHRDLLDAPFSPVLPELTVRQIVCGDLRLPDLRPLHLAPPLPSLPASLRPLGTLTSPTH
jgi:hypothetical protein